MLSRTYSSISSVSPTSSPSPSTSESPRRQSFDSLVLSDEEKARVIHESKHLHGGDVESFSDFKNSNAKSTPRLTKELSLRIVPPRPTELSPRTQNSLQSATSEICRKKVENLQVLTSCLQRRLEEERVRFEEKLEKVLDASERAHEEDISSLQFALEEANEKVRRYQKQIRHKRAGRTTSNQGTENTNQSQTASFLLRCAQLELQRRAKIILLMKSRQERLLRYPPQIPPRPSVRRGSTSDIDTGKAMANVSHLGSDATRPTSGQKSSLEVVVIRKELDDANERIRILEEELDKARNASLSHGIESDSISLELESPSEELNATLHTGPDTELVHREKTKLDIHFSETDLGWISNQEADVSSLRATLQEVNAENTILRAKVVSLECDLEELQNQQADLVVLRQSKTELEVNNVQLSSDVNELDEENSRLKSEMVDLNNDLNEVKDNFNSTLGKSTDNIQVDNMHDKLQNQIVEMNAENTALRAQNLELEYVIEDLKGDVSNGQAERDRIIGDLEALRDKEEMSVYLKEQVEELSGENTALRSKLHEVSTERDELRSHSQNQEDSTDSKMQDLNAENTALRAQNLDLHYEVEDLKSEFAKLKDEQDCMMAKADAEMQSKSDMNLSLQAELGMLREENLRLQYQASTLTTKLDEADVKLSNHASMHKELQTNLERENTDLRAQNIEHGYDIEDLKARLARLQGEHERDTVELDRLRGEIDSKKRLENIVQSLRDEEKKLQGESETLRKRLEDALAQISDLRDEKSEYTSSTTTESMALQAQNLQLEYNVEDLKAEVAVLRQTLVSHECGSQECAVSTQGSSEEDIVLRAQNQALQHRLQDARRKLEQLQSLDGEEAANYQGYGEVLSNSDRDFDAVLLGGSCNAKIQQKVVNEHREESEGSVANDAILQLRGENAQLLLDLEDQKCRNARLQQHNKLHTVLKAQIDALKTENVALRAQGTQLKVDIENLKHQLKETCELLETERLHFAEQQNSDKAAVMVLLNEQRKTEADYVTKLQLAQDNLEAERSLMNKKHAELHEEQQSALSKLELTKRELKHLEEEHTRAKTDVENLRSNLEQVKSDLSESESCRAVLEKNLAHFEENKQMYDAEAEQYKEDLATLELQLSQRVQECENLHNEVEKVKNALHEKMQVIEESKNILMSKNKDLEVQIEEKSSSLCTLQNRYVEVENERKQQAEVLLGHLEIISKLEAKLSEAEGNTHIPSAALPLVEACRVHTDTCLESEFSEEEGLAEVDTVQQAWPLCTTPAAALPLVISENNATTKVSHGTAAPNFEAELEQYSRQNRRLRKQLEDTQTELEKIDNTYAKRSSHLLEEIRARDAEVDLLRKELSQFRSVPNQHEKSTKLPTRFGRTSGVGQVSDDAEMARCSVKATEHERVKNNDGTAALLHMSEARKLPNGLIVVSTGVQEEVARLREDLARSQAARAFAEQRAAEAFKKASDSARLAKKAEKRRARISAQSAFIKSEARAVFSALRERDAHLSELIDFMLDEL